MSQQLPDGVIQSQSVRPKPLCVNAEVAENETEEEKIDRDLQKIEARLKEIEGEEKREREEEEQGRQPATRRTPAEPTRKEIEEHELTHTPFRSWCPQCVQGRGRQNAHKTNKEGEEKGLPSFHLDYWIMRDKPGAQHHPVITMVEEKTGTHKAYVVPSKGYVDHVAKKLVQDVSELGFDAEILMKCDQEAALTDLVKGMKRIRRAPIIVEHSKAKDSQSNGRAERGVQTVEGITRTLKLALERRLGVGIPCSHPIMSWLIPHGAETVNKCQVGQDGRTAWERVRGKKYRGEVLEFGRRVHHRFPGKPAGGVMDRRWGYGIWLGKRACSDEHIIAHEDGTIVRTSSVAVLPLSESWKSEIVMNLNATPWNLTGKEMIETENHAEPRGGPSTSRSSTTMEEQKNVGVPQPEAIPGAPRGVHIKHSYLEKFGYTPGCIKCGDIQVGRMSDSKRGHSIDCRNRLRECMRKDEYLKEQLDKSDTRMDEYLAKQIEMEDKNTEEKRRRIIDAPMENTELTPGTSSGTNKDDKNGNVQSGTSTNQTNDVSMEQHQTVSGNPDENIDNRVAQGNSEKRSRDELDDQDERERPTHFQVTEYDSDVTEYIWGQQEDEMSDTRDEMGGLYSSSTQVIIRKNVPKNNANSKTKKKSSTEAPAAGESAPVSAPIRRNTSTMSTLRRTGAENSEYDVCEAFSPPRICPRARERGLRGGWSLDLMHTDPITGQKWDLRVKENQERVLRMIRKHKPRVLTVGPPCTMFSLLQNLSGDPRVRCPERWKEACDMIEFAVKMCTEQAKAGRLYVFEHPLGAASWKLECMRELASRWGSRRATCHMCAFGMQARDDQGTDAVMKPTGILTNSTAIYDKMNVQCRGGHRHVHLVNGRAAKAAEYPIPFVDAILDAIEIGKQGEIYNISIAKDIDPTTLHEKEFDDWHFVDDSTGRTLEKALVQRAREEEMETFKQMGVYEYVARGKEWNGKKVGVRWVDVAKNGGVRSRLVAQEFAGRGGDRDDIFAATPPLAATKLILSDVASQGRHGPGRKKIMIIDVKRAFLYGDITEDVFIELPDEDPMKQKGFIGKLRKAMYGTRAAPQVWQDTVRKTMGKFGFTPTYGSPCVFYHPLRDLRVVAHVDDFICSGTEEDLRWMHKCLQEDFDVKMEILGGGLNDVKEAKFLGRTLRWSHAGVCYEADSKHATILLEEWKMENSRSVCSPGVDEEKGGKTSEGVQDEPLNEVEAKAFRRAAARLNYMSLDRPDLSFCAKELSRGMSSPTSMDVVRLKRALRYIKGCPEKVIIYRWQDPPGKITCMCDSDWAGCTRTRRSTSGGALMRGRHLIAHWSSTQSTVALSSGEAELNSIIKGSIETLGLSHIMNEINLINENNEINTIKTDSSAAKGICTRLGSGKMKHLEVKQLWVQEVVHNKRLKIDKVPRAENPSDLMTHHWVQADAVHHLPAIGVLDGKGEQEGSRGELALASEGGCLREPRCVPASLSIGFC